MWYRSIFIGSLKRIVTFSKKISREITPYRTFSNVHVLKLAGFVFITVAAEPAITRKRGRPRKIETTDKPTKTPAKLKATTRTPRPNRKTTNKTTDVIHEKKPENISERTYQCDVCKRSFKYKSSLSLHHKEHSKLLVNHPMLCKSFQLVSLGKKFEKLKAQQADEKEIKCDKCSKAFLLYTKWLRHYKSKHLKLFKCKNCDRTCTSSLTLRQHCIRKHRQKLITTKAQLRKFKVHCQRLNLNRKARKTIGTGVKKGRY